MQSENSGSLIDSMDADNMAGGDNPVDLDQNIPTPNGGELKRQSEESVDELRNGEPAEALDNDDGEEFKGDGENDEGAARRDDIST